MTRDRNTIVVELVSKIYNMPPDEREKELTKYNIETYLTIQEHDTLLLAMTKRMDAFPCQDNGILRFLTAMSTSKRVIISIAGVVMFLITVVGVGLGIVGYFKH